MTPRTRSANSLSRSESRVLIAEDALAGQLGIWRARWRRHQSEIAVGGGLAAGFLLGYFPRSLPIRAAAGALGAAGVRIATFAVNGLFSAVRSARQRSADSNNNHQPGEPL